MLKKKWKKGMFVIALCLFAFVSAMILCNRKMQKAYAENVHTQHNVNVEIENLQDAAKMEDERLWDVECESLAKTKTITPSTRLFSNTSTVSGKITLLDSLGNESDLKNTWISLRASLGNTTYDLVTGYTDNEGNYELSFPNPSITTVFLRVFPAGRSDAGVLVVHVTKNAGFDHYYDSPLIAKNMEAGMHITYNVRILDNNELSNAFEMSQAIIIGANYVYEMSGISNISSVQVIYPSTVADIVSNGAGYLFGTIRIPLEIPNGDLWDTVLHEYGHHIGNFLGIDKHPRQFDWSEWPQIAINYTMSSSLFDYSGCKNYSKSQCIRLAWAEAWAEYFQAMVRNDYSSKNNPIPSYNIINCDSGEAGVHTIEKVLYEVYTRILLPKANQDAKTAHKILWQIIKEAQSVESHNKSFSTFAVYFANKYPQYTDEFGKILTEHGMASVITTKNGISQSNSLPSFEWTAGGGSIKYPNNSFNLVFYNESYQEILRIENLLSTSHIINQSQWNSILNASGSDFRDKS